MIFCSVADDRAGHKGGKFAYTQKRVYNFLSKYDMIYRYNMWTTEDILESKYYTQHKDLLDEIDPGINGRLYKPLLIKDTLDKLDMGDYLVYNDMSPDMWDNLLESADGGWFQATYKTEGRHYKLGTLRDLIDENRGILTSHQWYDYGSGPAATHIGHHTHNNFTSEGCIDAMKAEAYRHHLQHASGFVAMKKTPETISFVDEWIHYNSMPECAGVVRLTNKAGHRHDQSISGILINRSGRQLIRKLSPPWFDDRPACSESKKYYNIDPHLFLNYCQTNTRYDWVNSSARERVTKYFTYVGGDDPSAQFATTIL